VDGKWGKNIPLFKPGIADFLSGVIEIASALELGCDSVDWCVGIADGVH
jgi:hypothetical protein